MPIPTWVPGQVLTASDVNTWFVPDLVAKAADTPRASTTVIATDPDLVIPGASNSVYRVDGLILYSGAGGNSGLLQFQFTVPSGASCDISATYEYASGGLDAGATIAYLPAATTISRIAWTGGAATGYAVLISGLFTTSTTAGNLSFRWSQNISNATATVVKAGSYLTLTKFG